jgi:hypothetical protein
MEVLTEQNILGAFTSFSSRPRTFFCVQEIWKGQATLMRPHDGCVRNGRGPCDVKEKAHARIAYRNNGVLYLGEQVRKLNEGSQDHCPRLKRRSTELVVQDLHSVRKIFVRPDKKALAAVQQKKNPWQIKCGLQQEPVLFLSFADPPPQHLLFALRKTHNGRNRGITANVCNRRPLSQPTKTIQSHCCTWNWLAGPERGSLAMRCPNSPRMYAPTLTIVSWHGGLLSAWRRKGFRYKGFARQQPRNSIRHFLLL